MGTSNLSTESAFDRRKRRVRHGLRKQRNARVRLSVHRSAQHIYAQVIDDATGTTLAAASSMDKEFKGKVKGGNLDGARQVGQLVAQRARKANVTQVVFDRGGYIYHGRVKALADAAREAGLEF